MKQEMAIGGPFASQSNLLSVVLRSMDHRLRLCTDHREHDPASYDTIAFDVVWLG
jgi:hypothetical protein